MPSTHGASLDKRPFGRTQLPVTPLCIGCAPLANVLQRYTGVIPEEEALATLRALFRSPINFLDTAAGYGDGESERRIGLVLRELGGLPPGIVLATKIDPDRQTRDFSGAQARRSVDRSLRLLGLDRLQLVYIHDPERIPFEQAMEPGGPVATLLALKAEGVIEHVGVPGGPIDLMLRYVETGTFDAVLTHNRYTLLDQSAVPLLDLAARLGLGLANAAPYGSGILAKGPDAHPHYAYRDATPQQLERVRQIAAVCRRYDVPLAAAALQFSLRDPRIASTVVGMSHPERVAQTLALAAHPIPPDLWRELGYPASPPSH